MSQPQSQNSMLFSQESLSFLNNLTDLNELLISKDMEPVIEVKNECTSGSTSDGNNVELSMHQWRIPTNSLLSLLNSCTSTSAFTDNIEFLTPAGELDLQQTPCTTTTVQTPCTPSNASFTGDYGFKTHIVNETGTKKTNNWTYSEKINKLACKRLCACPINIQIDKMPPYGSQIRFTIAYSKLEHMNDVIKRCLNHINEDNDGHQAASHFVRLEHVNATYFEEANGRHSVCVPYETPQTGCDYTTFICKFMCFNTCIGGEKKPTQLILTLEHNGCILGRQIIQLKVCACPLRDLKNELKRFPSKSNLKATKEVEITSIKKNQNQATTATQNNANANQLVANSAFVTPSTITTSAATAGSNNNNNEQIYHLAVRGYSNYMLLAKIRDSLDLQNNILNSENANEVTKLIKKSSSISKYDLIPTIPISPRKQQQQQQQLQISNKLDTNEDIQVFLTRIKLDMKGYLKIFTRAGYTKTHQLLNVKKSDIENLNINERHTNEIWNEICKLKRENNVAAISEDDNNSQTPSQQPSSSQLASTCDSIEIKKINMRYTCDVNMKPLNKRQSTFDLDDCLSTTTTTTITTKKNKKN